MSATTRTATTQATAQVTTQATADTSAHTRATGTVTEVATDGTVWTAVCRYESLVPERGVAALLGGEPVAVFRMHDGAVYALSNIDPFSQASVLSRGIVGDREGRPTLASPVYKQVFDLETGVCLDDDTVTVRPYPVRVVAGRVEIGRVEVGRS